MKIIFADFHAYFSIYTKWKQMLNVKIAMNFKNFKLKFKWLNKSNGVKVQFLKLIFTISKRYFKILSF